MQYFSVVLGEPYEGRYEEYEEEEEKKKATMTHTYASRSPGRSRRADHSQTVW
jgi:hypothetical protein